MNPILLSSILLWFISVDSYASSAQKKIRVGVIGLGNHMEENILPSLKLISGLELSYACCTKLEKAQNKAYQHGIKHGCVDWKELADKHLVDAFVVSGPPSLHTEVAEFALPKGLHVFTEKPYSLDLKHSNKLAKIDHGNFAVGFNFIHTKMHELLRNNKDEIQHLKIQVLSSKPRGAFWNLSTTEESFLYAVGVHGISVVADLMGKPESIHVFHTSMGNQLFSMQVVLKYKYGKFASLHFGNYQNRFVNKVEAINKGGQVYSGDGFRKMQMNQASVPQFHKKEYISFEESILSGGFDVTGYRAELLEFFKNISSQNGAGIRANASLNLTVHKIIGEIVSQLHKND